MNKFFTAAALLTAVAAIIAVGYSWQQQAKYRESAESQMTELRIQVKELQNLNSSKMTRLSNLSGKLEQLASIDSSNSQSVSDNEAKLQQHGLLNDRQWQDIDALRSLQVTQEKEINNLQFDLKQLERKTDNLRRTVDGLSR